MTEDKIKYILSLFQGELDKYSNDDEYKAYLYEKINKALGKSSMPVDATDGLTKTIKSFQNQ